MMDAGIFVAAFVLIVAIVTYGLQALILLMRAVALLGRVGWTLLLVLLWVVWWVFDHKAAMAAFRRTK